MNTPQLIRISIIILSGISMFYFGLDYYHHAWLYWFLGLFYGLTFLYGKE